MVDLEALYARLPVRLQHLACSAEGLRIERRRFGRGFDDVIRQVEQRAAARPEEFLAFRDRRLRELLAHAVETVPFYRRRFSEARIDVREVQTQEDLARLPLLTKDDIRAAGDDMFSTAVPPRARQVAHTSGTTGAGLRFATTTTAVREQWAVWWRHWRRLGIERGTWCGYFVGRSIVPIGQTQPPFWRYNHPQRRILFSAYHANDVNLDAYIAELKRRRPPWLHGYPSVLTLVAERLLATRADLGYQVRWITTSAENLLLHQVQTITSAFGVTPSEHYGMAEAAANASACEQGVLHVDEDFAALELVVNGDSLTAKVIGTSLSNRAMPLIRYVTNDLATPASSCSCGLPGRVIASVDGRHEDYVVLRNGARLGRLDHIFKDMVNIREAQIRQSKPGEVVLRVVRRDGYGGDDEAALVRETEKRLGPDTDIRLEYVAALEREPNGKLRFVVSELE